MATDLGKNLVRTTLKIDFYPADDGRSVRFVISREGSDRELSSSTQDVPKGADMFDVCVSWTETLREGLQEDGLALVPGPTFDQLVSKRLEEEKKRPKAWWYLSFSKNTGDPTTGKWLGANVLFDHGVVHAIQQSHRLGINPGGQFLGTKIPPDLIPPPEFRNRLLSEEDKRSMWKDVQIIEVMVGGQEDLTEDELAPDAGKYADAPLEEL
jgi:hypothetical protein